ncbi:MAG: PIN domain-containing protein [Chloroflexi bacterium]|nr:PIN domain-containing protein [Chloroflexota bacterium]MBI3741046.1 PIN domain-containing protein [Chloroflexota bacterium]
MRRKQGPKRAEELLKDSREFPLTLEPATEERIFAAARLKAEHSISYADAFAVALAGELKATVVTGDPEFKSLESKVNLLWLETK